MELSTLVKLSTVSYIHHVVDEEISWYEVHLEPQDDSVIQTVEFTVGTHEELEKVLVANGWTITPEHIRTYNNTTGQLS